MNYLDMLQSRRADLETLVGRSLWTSVKVRDHFVRANALQSHLHKFAQILAEFTNVEGYEVRLSGSATGLDYCGKKLLVCTAHQLNDVSGQDVGIVISFKNQYVSSAGYTRFRASDSPPESDAEAEIPQRTLGIRFGATPRPLERWQALYLGFRLRGHLPFRQAAQRLQCHIVSGQLLVRSAKSLVRLPNKAALHFRGLRWNA